MIENVITNIKAQLYERAVSPLMGTFIFSWAAWNYRFILLLISSEPVREKFKITSDILYTDYKTTLFYGVVFPSLTTVLYLFAYPYRAKFVYQFSLNRQRGRSNIKREIEEETLLTVKESQTLRRQLNTLEEEFQKILSKK